MLRKTCFFLTLALVFALAPSLEAQTTRTTVTVRGQEMPTTMSLPGRTLQGMLRRGMGSELYIYNVKFGWIQGGGGNPNVVEIRYYDGRESETTTVDKMGYLKDGGYIIKLAANHFLDISGESSEKGGLVGKKFYVIRGPTELYINYPHSWPNIFIGFSSDYDTMVYENWAEYKSEIAGQFVDEYIMPMVSYAETKEAYDRVRFLFWEYFNTTDTTKYNVCPENIGCLCGGNIPHHIIYSTTMKRGLMAGLISGVTDAFGNYVGDKFETAFGDDFTKAYGDVAGETLDEASENKFKKAISDKIGGAFGDQLGGTAEAISRFEENSTKVPTVLSAIIGYHYGWYPDEETFKSRFRDHAAVLYSDAPFSDRGAGMALTALRAVVDFCVDKIGDLMGIKLLTSVVSFAIDGISAAWDVSNIGYRADRFFQVSGSSVVNWIPPGATNLPQNVNVVFQNASVSDTSKEGFLMPANSSPRNNTGIQLGTMVSDGSTHRIFQLQHVGGGWYRIKNNKFGVLTVPPGGENKNDVQMVLSPQDNNNLQSQRFLITGNGPYQIWTHYGRNLDVNNAWFSRISRVVTWASSNSRYASQRWSIYTVDGQGELSLLGYNAGYNAVYDERRGPFTWTVNPWDPFEKSNISGIAYGTNTWVAVGDDGKIAYSKDNGRLWTAVPPGTARVQSTFGTTNINSVAFGGRGTFIAVGDNGKMASSSGGTSWSAIPPGTGNGQSGFPTNINIRGIANSGDGWVAVGDQSKTAYSTNGTTWTAEDAKYVFAPSGGNTQIKGIAYGTAGNAGRFVAVADNGRMAYSDWPRKPGSAAPPPTPITGPTNWTAVSNSTFGTSAIKGIAYGNNTWVAVGFGGKIAYSTDNSRTWTAIPPDTSRDGGPSGFGTINIHAVAFANNMFIAVGREGRIAASTDGKTWTAVTQPRFLGDNSDFYGVAYGGGRWVAVAESGRKAYSTNGRDWTAVDTTNAFNTDNNMHGVAFGNNRFVAIINKGKMAYSSNGASWTAVSNTTFGNTFNTIRGIIYANNRWVAVGANNIAYSSDGAAWTAVPRANIGDGGQNGSFNGVAFGNNRFVAVGMNGRIAYSADGASWTAVANTASFGFGSSTIDGIDAVAYGNGRFVAVGTQGKILYCDWGEQSSGTAAQTTTPPASTTDTANWIAVPNSTFGTSSINGVAFGNNRWVAVGASGKIAYSTNGASWTAVAPANNGGFDTTQINAVTFGNGMFVAVGDRSKIAYSENGERWTDIKKYFSSGVELPFDTDPFDHDRYSQIRAIAFGSRLFVIVGVYGQIAYSDNVR